MLTKLLRVTHFIKSLLTAGKNAHSFSLSISHLDTVTIRSYAEYRDYATHKHIYEGVNDIVTTELKLARNKPVFSVDGFCVVCNKQRKFYTSYKYASVENDRKIPNWREHLICLHCGLNSRQRAAFHVFRQQTQAGQNQSIYITEQRTFFFRMLKRMYPLTIGSEFFGDRLEKGDKDWRGIRNEDLCDLTFANDSIDNILSFDVFEHIPDYKRALNECYRCLKQGGSLLFSVPFNASLKQHLVRAEMGSDGAVRHLMEPEYHGNPMSNKGSLCFYHFGWNILSELKSLGFQDAFALLYWSRKYAYLGGVQIIFVAIK